MALPVYVTKDCDCTAPRGIGYSRPTEPCEPHGNRFITEREKERLAGSKVTQLGVGKGTKAKPASRRGGPPPRDWSLARTKVEEERCCRICKRSDRKLDAAHILGREHDEPKVDGDGRPLKELWVHPDRIIPACGPFPDGCHGDIDFHRINYLPYLTLSEQLRAVEDAGGIAQAYRALMPVERREERERSAA